MHRMPSNAIRAGGRIVVVLSIGVCFAPPVGADGPTPPTFERDVQPILRASCERCHGDRRRGGLDLRTFAGLLKGGESGPVVVPGQADKSLLFKQVHEGAMPADKKGT